MEKFNIKRMYGFYRMLISLISLFVLFVVSIIFTISLFYMEPNKRISEIMIVFFILDIVTITALITSIAVYLNWFLPFRSSSGKTVSVRITERSIGSLMYGVIESKDSNRRVKIRFVARTLINYFPIYEIVDYVECFVREQDLEDPKVVVLYR